MVTCIFLFTGLMKWMFFMDEGFHLFTYGFATALIVPQLLLLGKRLLTAVARPLSAVTKQKLQLNFWL